MNQGQSSCYQCDGDLTNSTEKARGICDDCRRKNTDGTVTK